MTKIVEWLDGDTVKINGKSYRLGGVDTPETHHEGSSSGFSTSGYLAQHVAESTKQNITPTDERGGYGRGLANLESDGLTSNEKLIRAGVAGYSTAGGKSFSELPPDVQDAVRTRQSNALFGLEDDDEDVRNIRAINQNLNRLSSTGPLSGIPIYRDYIKTKRDGNVLTNSLARGVDMMQGNLYNASAAIGDTFGIDSLKEFGERGAFMNDVEINTNRPNVGSIDDVHSFGDALTYGIERIAEFAPTAAATAATALGTGGVGMLAGAGARGAMLGVGAFSTAQNMGDAYESAKQAGVENAGATALLTGSAMGALDTVGIGKIFTGVMKSTGVSDAIAKETLGTLAKTAVIAKDVGKTAGKSALIEGTTEAAQEVIKDIGIELAGGDTSKLGDRSSRYLESAIAGGIIGGGFGGAGRAVKHGIDHVIDNRKKVNQRDEEAQKTAHEFDEHAQQVDQYGNVTHGFNHYYNPNAANIEPEQGTPNTRSVKENTRKKPTDDVVSPPVMDEVPTYPATDPVEPELESNTPVANSASGSVESDITPLPELDELLEPRMSDVENKLEPQMEAVSKAEPKTEVKRPDIGNWNKNDGKQSSYGFDNPRGYNIRDVVDNALDPNSESIPQFLRDKVIGYIAKKNNVTPALVLGRSKRFADRTNITDQASTDPELNQLIRDTIQQEMAEANTSLKEVEASHKKVNGKLRKAVDFWTQRLKNAEKNSNQNAINHAKTQLKRNQDTLELSKSKVKEHQDRVKAVFDYASEFRINNARKLVNMHKLNASARETIESDIEKRFAKGTERKQKMTEFKVLVGNGTIDPLANFIRVNTNHGARHAKLWAHAILSKANNIDEFAKEYDSSLPVETVYDRIHDGFPKNLHKIFTDDFQNLFAEQTVQTKVSEDVGKTARKSAERNHKLTEVDKQANNKPEFERTATDPNDGSRAKDLRDFVTKVVNIASAGFSVAKRGLGYESYYDENGVKQEADDKTYNQDGIATPTISDGLDENNISHFEALAIAANNEKYLPDSKVHDLYRGLAITFGDEMQQALADVKTKTRDDIVRFRRAIGALANRKIKEIEQRMTEQITVTAREYVTAAVTANRLEAQTQFTNDAGSVANNTNMVGLAEKIRGSLKYPEQELEQIAHNLNTTPERIKKVLDALVEAISSTKEGDAIGSVMTAFDEAIENSLGSERVVLENLKKSQPALREAIDSHRKRYTTSSDARYAWRTLASENWSNFSPSDIVRRLKDLGILSDVEITFEHTDSEYQAENGTSHKNVAFVNANSAVTQNTPDNHVVSILDSNGLKREINMPRLVGAEMKSLKTIKGMSESFRFATAMNNVFGRLLTYRDTVGRTFSNDNVIKTFRELPDSSVVYIHGNAEVTMGDYRKVMETLYQQYSESTQERDANLNRNLDKHASNMMKHASVLMPDEYVRKARKQSLDKVKSLREQISNTDPNDAKRLKSLDNELNQQLERLARFNSGNINTDSVTGIAGVLSKSIETVLGDKYTKTGLIESFIESAQVVLQDRVDGDAYSAQELEIAKNTLEEISEDLATLLAELRLRARAGANAMVDSKLTGVVDPKQASVLAHNITEMRRAYYAAKQVSSIKWQNFEAERRLSELTGYSYISAKQEAEALYGEHYSAKSTPESYTYGLERNGSVRYMSVSRARIDGSEVAHIFGTSRLAELDFTGERGFGSDRDAISRRQNYEDTQKLIREVNTNGIEHVIVTEDTDSVGLTTVTLTTRQDGKIKSTETVQVTDVTNLNEVIDKARGKPVFYYGNISVIHGSMPHSVDMKQFLANTDGFRFTHDIESANALVGNEKSKGNVTQAEALANIIDNVLDRADAAALATAYRTPVRKAGANTIDGDPSITFFRNGESRNVDKSGVAKNTYKVVHSLLKRAGIAEDIAIHEGSSVNFKTVGVETVIGNNGQLQHVIHLPVLNQANAVEWVAALGHEIGHLVIQPYLNAFNTGKLHIDTQQAMQELYGDTFSDPDAIEKFADNYSQHFASTLTDGEVDVEGSLFKLVADKLRAVATAIVDALRKLTKRDSGAITDKHAKLFKELAQGRQSMGEFITETKKREFLQGQRALKNGIAWRKTFGVHAKRLASNLLPTHGRLKRISPAIADMFLSTKGGTGYANIKRKLNQAFIGIQKTSGIAGNKLTNAIIERGYTDLINGRDTPAAKAVKSYVERIRRHVRDELDPNGVGAYGMSENVKTDVPFKINPTKIEQQSAKVKQILESLGVSYADQLIDAAINGRDSVLDINGPEAWSAVLADSKNRKALAEFLDQNGVTVLNSYAYNLAHGAAKRMAFGAHARNLDGTLAKDDNGKVRFIPMAKLNHYVQTLNNDEVEVISDVLHAINGNYAFKYMTADGTPHMKHPPQWLRKTMNITNMAGNMAVLTFAGINNIMDTAVPLMLSGDMGVSMRAIASVFSKMKHAELKEMAKTLGVLEYGVIQNTVAGLKMSDNKLENAMGMASGAYFTVTGMNATTKLARLMGVAVAVEAMRTAAIDPKKAYLLEPHGISIADVQTALNYIGNGNMNKIFGDLTDVDPTIADSVRKFRNGVVDFVNNSTLDPNEITDPLIATNPWFQLLTNLKRFFYAYHHTVFKGLLQRAEARYGAESKIAATAMPAAMMFTFMLPLSLLSWWLREWWRDGDMERGNPFGKPLDELVLGAFTRAGATGIAEIYFNAAQATEYGTPWWLTMTPSVATGYRAGEAISDGNYYKAFKTVMPLWDKTYITSNELWGDLLAEED
ncbi:thermonuclease family protein [Pasteurella canis]|uniref:thermonuclease family protein n=1 Tax=Pasteurella canis TaxID=753 RepID=UPI001D111F2E|nr:thermonuclease family protein [Pasteurella canis]UDW84631.1 thermonuclease family protein [Pasteurella canis]